MSYHKQTTSGHHRKKPRLPRTKQVNRTAEFVEFVRSHNPYDVIGQQGDDQVKRVAKLEQTGPTGCALAGELCMELAFRHPDIETSAELLQRAKHDFEFVIANRTPGRAMNSHQANALLYLAQLPNLAVMSSGRLPSTSQAAKAYGETVEAAAVIVSSLERARTDRDPRLIELVGVAAEASVLLPSQRHAIWEGMFTDSWFSMLSFSSEDRRNKAHDTHNSSWDINVFTQNGQTIEAIYRAQVMSSPNAKKIEDPPEDSGIVPIYVRPDLKLPGEKFTISTIINECVADWEGSSEQASTNLTQRANQLLDAFDNPPALANNYPVQPRSPKML